MKKKNKEITQKDCLFLLLVKIPKGTIHEVFVTQAEIYQMISDSGKFRISEQVIEGINFEKTKQ